ncbi:MAG: ParB/RepB/Spo0J family partition protein [Paracoccaceae bacterium]
MSDKKTEKRGLGRGLSALMADIHLGPKDEAEGERPRRGETRLPVEMLEPNPDQPRRAFPREALEELAASIREKGIIQPLIVRESPRKTGGYEIVAGERRWRAAQLAQLHEVPALIRDLDDTEVLELAIIENIQRADLNPIEEALGFRQLMDRFGHTQEKLAEALSKSRSYIANILRLLTLPQDIQNWLIDGQLTAGHARALITADNPLALAREVLAKGLSVRETERLAKVAADAGRKPVKKRHLRPEKDADTRMLERDLSAHLRMKVLIEHQGEKGGKLTLSYTTLDQLDELCQLLSATA